MAKFSVATPEQNTSLTAKGASASAIDLTPYTRAVDAALRSGRYGILTLDEGDSPDAERRRIAKAAKLLSPPKRAIFHADSGEQEVTEENDKGEEVTVTRHVLIFRVADPPKVRGPRAAKSAA